MVGHENPAENAHFMLIPFSELRICSVGTLARDMGFKRTEVQAGFKRTEVQAANALMMGHKNAAENLHFMLIYFSEHKICGVGTSARDMGFKWT